MYYLLMAFIRITTFLHFYSIDAIFSIFQHLSLSLSLSSMFSISNALSLSSLASVFELGVWSYCPEIAALKALTFGVLYLIVVHEGLFWP